VSPALKASTPASKCSCAVLPLHPAIKTKAENESEKAIKETMPHVRLN
jgi:hypothetical protein